MKLPLVSILSVFLTETDARIGLGGCGDIKVKEDFDWTKAEGLWYETWTDWSNWPEWFWSCTTESYTKSEFNDNVYRISTPYRLGWLYFKWA